MNAMTSPLRKAESTFVETAIDDETIIMQIDSAEFFSLNLTGGEVWRLIDGTRDRDAIVAQLAADYGVGAAEIGPEIDELLGELREAGFLASD